MVVVFSGGSPMLYVQMRRFKNGQVGFFLIGPGGFFSWVYRARVGEQQTGATKTVSARMRTEVPAGGVCKPRDEERKFADGSKHAGKG